MIGRLGTILKWAILLPILIAIVLFAAANDQTVTVHLNPLSADDAVLRVDLALYQVGFLAFFAGALIGGFVTWRGQRKHRQRARDRQHEAVMWRSRAKSSERRMEAAQPAAASGLLPRPERG